MTIPTPTRTRKAITLRRYRAGDLKTIVSLDRRCFAEPFRFSLRAMRAFAEAPNALTLIAEPSSGLLAGFIIAHLEPIGGELCGYVVTLDVEPTLVRSGIATHLVQQAEHVVAAAGAFHMRLHVHTENAAAVAFYQARGYSLISREPGFYGEDRAADLYQKDLAAP